jgi:hypothetical protein
MAPGFLIGCHRRREFLLLNLVAAEGRARKDKLPNGSGSSPCCVLCRF